MYNERGVAVAVWLDFDGPANRSGRDAVARDRDAVAAALRGAGVAHLVTYNRSGRGHIIIPVAGGIAHRVLDGPLRRLRDAFGTLDVSPMLNPSTGCMRPPGSPHKRGGYQVVAGGPDRIAAALAGAAGPGAVLACLERLSAAPAPTARQPVLAPPRGPAQPPSVLGGKAQRIAARGPRPEDGFRSDSEARMHVAGAAARAGWQTDDYLALAAGQHWLHRQYTDGRDRMALARHEFEKARSNAWQSTTVHLPDTSHTDIHGGGHSEGPKEKHNENLPADYLLTAEPAPDCGDVHTRLRRVRAEVVERSWREGWDPLTLTVALGVLWFAHSRGEMRLRCGVRALAVCCHTTRTTAADRLHRLAELGIITRIAAGRGEAADLWTIHDAPDQDPAKGDLHVLPPAFRAMPDGHGLSRVHDVLRRAERAGEGGLSGREVARRAGLSPATVNDRLAALHSQGLAAAGPARRGHPTWVLGLTDPDELAARNGGTADQAAQIDRYRAERAQWRQWLRARKRATDDRYEDPPDHWDDPLLAPPRTTAGTPPARDGPGSSDAAVLQYLARELGAAPLHRT